MITSRELEIQEMRAYSAKRLREIADYHDDLAKHSGSGWHDDVAVTLRDAADALLDRPLPLPSLTWWPMESAPKDATWFIGLLASGEVCRVHYASDLSGSEQPPFQGFFRQTGRASYAGCDPTHWLPLPPTSAARAPEKKL